MRKVEETKESMLKAVFVGKTYHVFVIPKWAGVRAAPPFGRLVSQELHVCVALGAPLDGKRAVPFFKIIATALA